MSTTRHPSCPSCGSLSVESFYEVRDVPTNSVLLFDDRTSAEATPRGDIVLTVCEACGHVFNAAFEAELTEYSQRYESTQAYSATFNSFHRRLAEDLIERFDVRGKQVIEIGCGNGEFLSMLCALGANSGLGFDPAYRPGRVESAGPHDVRFVADFYSEAQRHHLADLVVCKMTLEHVIDTARFVRTVRSSLADQHDAVVLFQVPNAHYVIDERAFWDVYYEHCSYFSADSLATLFERAGFDVTETWTDYDDQYLMLAAGPLGPDETARAGDPDGAAGMVSSVRSFAADIGERIDWWARLLDSRRGDGKRVVLWGGGSKAVAFLTTVPNADVVAAAVDINPTPADTFLPGSGHPVVPPSALREIDPDLVVVMNPVYVDEIRDDLARLELDPEVVAVS